MENNISNDVNVNLNNFATELSELIGQHIGLDHIHPSTEGRYYYIQSPKAGAPMLLHHYRGPFFIDIHPDDFEDISSGKISAHDYIMSANWQVGYYWGGGSMVGGGYYQPINIVERKDEVRRYLRILSCRGCRQSCGYMPSEKDCTNCHVENCPFSKYKKGNWDAEMSEFDPRVELFKALRVRFEQENPGYTLRGFLCGEIPDEEIHITPIGHYTEGDPFAFTAYASESLIQSLLMHETEPENWTNYAESFHFRIFKMFDSQTYEVSKGALEKAYEGLDYTKKANTQPEDVNEEKVPLMTRVLAFFKKMF